MTDKENTILTNIDTFDCDNINFSEPIKGSIPDSTPKIEFSRINISVKNPDGTKGELILPTGRLYSFGISENKSQETKQITGYTLPLCLYGRDGPTKEEKQWVETFDNIVGKCVDHIIDNKDEIGMFDITRPELERSKGGLNPLYWKKELYEDPKTGKKSMRNVPGRGPTLYSKLIYSKKADKFLTMFWDVNDNQLDATELMGTHCYVRAAIKIESIFIGSRISLQVKMHQAIIEPTSRGFKRLLMRPQASDNILNSGMNSLSILDNDDNDSILGSDDEKEEEKPPPKPVKKKVVRKVKKSLA